MIETKQLPHLIKLLDDDSSVIRGQVIKELSKFGPRLKDQVKQYSLNSRQKDCINYILDYQKYSNLKRVWSCWYNLSDENFKLETALTVLSEFLSDHNEEDNLEDLLSELAFEYRKKFRVMDARLLAQFLFKEYCLKGNDKDYYNPQNNNLVYVIKNKLGIPISLTVIYMLVGRRLNIDIQGCNFPGHFLARINCSSETVFVDCFSSGQVIEEDELLNLRDDYTDDVEKLLNEKASAENIIKRFLANLIRSYQIQKDELNSELMIELFKELDMRLAVNEISDLSPEDIIGDKKPLFSPGQVLSHKRYGYRGIVVDIDLDCKATDQWYYGNQTQPKQNQPWYHVLVHGSDQVTYVAQSNLFEDDSADEIEHPLISYFFTKTNGQYIRNGNPWPATDF